MSNGATKIGSGLSNYNQGQAQAQRQIEKVMQPIKDAFKESRGYQTTIKTPAFDRGVWDWRK
jgi:hypothetical protein